MTTVTASVKLTKTQMKDIDELVEKGIYTSRSEAIRSSVRDRIASYRGILKGKVKKEQITEEDKARALRELAKENGWEL